MKLKHITSIPILALALAIFCQCGGHLEEDGYGQDYPLDPESYAVIDSCMAYMDSDPSRAHHMLDSVCDAGIMSQQRCRYLHALVVFEGESLPDSALLMCNRLLDEDRFGDDHFLEAEICELASNISSACSRYVEVLQYTNRGIALCHGREQLRSDEASMMGRAGVAHQMLGHYQEARETYNQALDLLREDTSFGGLIALFSLQKKQGSLYRDSGDYDSLIAVCHDILAKVEHFDRDPSFVNPRPATMTEPGEATHGFVDFYQTQMYNFLAGAYRMKVEHGVSANPTADRDSASAYVEKWMNTAGSRLPQNMAFALRELYFTGQRAEFDAAKQSVGQFFGSDTLVLGYVDYLKLMAEDAASRNDYIASNGYLQRIAILNDSIRQRELLRTFSEQMSIHMVQDAQLAQLDAEYQLSRNRILTSFLGILLLACIAINVLFLIARRRKRVLEAVQQDLEETKEVVIGMEHQLEEVRSERAAGNMAALYKRIEEAVIDKRLYLNPDLDIKMLAEHVSSSRTNISGCINSLTGKSFRVWLAEYRLGLFVELLKQNPNVPFEELMNRCGYQEQSTFRRQFKAFYGMTAGEYRKKVINK